jgi:hypothetical protein
MARILMPRIRFEDSHFLLYRSVSLSRTLIPKLLLLHLLIQSLRCSTLQIYYVGAPLLPHSQCSICFPEQAFAYHDHGMLIPMLDHEVPFHRKNSLSVVGTLWGRQQVTFGWCLIRSTIDVGIVAARLGNCTKRKPPADRILYDPLGNGTNDDNCRIGGYQQKSDVQASHTKVQRILRGRLLFCYSTLQIQHSVGPSIDPHKMRDTENQATAHIMISKGSTTENVHRANTGR